MNMYNGTDPTAAEAMGRIKEAKRRAVIDKKAKDTIIIIRKTLAIAGFRIDGELVIEHKACGLKYR